VIAALYSMARFILLLEYSFDPLKHCYYFNYDPYVWCSSQRWHFHPISSETILWGAITLFITFILVLDNHRRSVV
jgi:hypothetical protein